MENTTALSVHRCRFVDYAPSAITALAFPPLPLPKRTKKTTARNRSFKFGFLAVGHANGNIDLCEWMGTERQIQCSQAWVVRKVCCYSYFFRLHRVLNFVYRHCLVLTHPKSILLHLSFDIQKI